MVFLYSWWNYILYKNNDFFGLFDYDNYHRGIIPLGTYKTIKYHCIIMVMRVIFSEVTA